MINFISVNNDFFLKSFLKYGINTPLRIAHFLAQLAHESADFTRMVENLNYTPQGLMSTNPFNKKLTKEQANKYGRTAQHPANQKMIANIAYANKNGNGNVASGDGWKYRGRGFIQLTGRSNYQAYKKYSGHDVINNPDLLLQTDIAIDCAAWFWIYGTTSGNLNKYADSNLITRITEAINGLTNGLSDRIKKFKYFKAQNISIEVLKKKAKIRTVKRVSGSFFNTGRTVNNLFFK